MSESLPAVSAMTDRELAKERDELLDALLKLGESYRSAMQRNSEAEREAHRLWGEMQGINTRLQEIALQREARGQ